MSHFRISTPVKDFTGEVGGCTFTKGIYVGDVGAGPLAYFAAQGYTVEEIPDTPAEVEEIPDPAAEPAIDLDALPARSAARSEWIAAAIARDIDQADAKKATKEQLIELLTTPKEADQ